MAGALVFGNCTFVVTQIVSMEKAPLKNFSSSYDMRNWGEEKTGSLLECIIHGLDLLDQNEERTDEFKDSDLKDNLRGLFGSMSSDLTKLHAFFCDGKWTTEDRHLVCNQREEGLAELRKRYKSE